MNFEPSALMVYVDFQTKPKLSTAGVCPAHGSPGLVPVLPTAHGISRAAEGVQPLQQGIFTRASLGGVCVWKAKQGNLGSILKTYP